MDHEITEVTDDGQNWNVGYFAADDTARERGTLFQIPYAAVYSRMALYGIADPGDALYEIVRETLALRQPAMDPRDDPALTAGWVTTTGPDAEPVHAYNARSTADAGGAYRCRHDALPDTVADPAGLLPAPDVDPELLLHYREHLDLTRWRMVYGGLPARPMNFTKEGSSRDR